MVCWLSGKLACEQAHLFGRGAATESWREEWGEEKWACTRAIDFWIPCVRWRTQWSDWFKLTGYRNQCNLSTFHITQTICRLCARSVPRALDWLWLKFWTKTGAENTWLVYWKGRMLSQWCQPGFVRVFFQSCSPHHSDQTWQCGSSYLPTDRPDWRSD